MGRSTKFWVELRRSLLLLMGVGKPRQHHRQKEQKTPPLAFFRARPPSARLSACHMPRSASGFLRGALRRWTVLTLGCKRARKVPMRTRKPAGPPPSHVRWGTQPRHLGNTWRPGGAREENCPLPSSTDWWQEGNEVCDTFARNKTQKTKPETGEMSSFLTDPESKFNYIRKSVLSWLGKSKQFVSSHVLGRL